MLNLDMFLWWAVSISSGIAFLILVSIYLYAGSRSKCRENNRKTLNLGLGKDFMFVWVLIGLLVFYIVTVNMGSAQIFAVGNIIVEAILLVYLVGNRRKKSEQVS